MVTGVLAGRFVNRRTLIANQFDRHRSDCRQCSQILCPPVESRIEVTLITKGCFTIRSRHCSPHEASCSVCTSKSRLQNKGRTMFQQIVRASIRKSRIQPLFAAAAMLIVVGVGSDLQAQIQCGGGRAGGGQMAGRAGGPGAAMGGGGGAMGGGANQIAQMMQMMQQAQQLQQMQRQAAMMQQAREQQQRQTRQQQAVIANQNATNSAASQSSESTKPTMTRRERLRLLIQQRREEKSQKRPSRRELAIERSSRNRQSVIVASAQPATTKLTE